MLLSAWPSSRGVTSGPRITGALAAGGEGPGAGWPRPRLAESPSARLLYAISKRRVCPGHPQRQGRLVQGPQSRWAALPPKAQSGFPL